MRASRRSTLLLNITAAVLIVASLLIFASRRQGDTTAGPATPPAGTLFPFGTGTWPPGTGSFGRGPGATATFPVGTATVPTTAQPPPPPPGSHPNVLVVMTDDQTLETLRVMPNVKRYLGTEGTTFSNYFVSFPVCCPSRATYLTGQYSHNNGVRDNILPLGGFTLLKGDETLPVWLQREGYYTASVGKYLNGWGQDGVSTIAPPPGWSHWFGLIDPTTYQYKGYSVSVDGLRREYGKADADYQTDVLGQEVVSTIKAGQQSQRPWFISFTPLAPHAGEAEVSATAARPSFDDIHPYGPARYAGAAANEEPPRTPSFAQKDLSGLPEDMRKLPPFFKPQLDAIRTWYQGEVEALLDVDEWVGTFMKTLQDTGQLDNTVVLFTSDNGFFHGEHRLLFVKQRLFEAGIHVPMLARGPMFPKGAVVDDIVGNVDLAPTIVAIAGAKAGITMDGRNLVPLAKDPAKGADRGLLLENVTDAGKGHTQGIRTDRYKYLVNEKNEEQLYDLSVDPDEVQNRANDPAMASVKADLVRRTAALKDCAGTACEGADPS